MNIKKLIFSISLMAFCAHQAGTNPLASSDPRNLIVNTVPNNFDDEIISRLESMDCLVEKKIVGDVIDQVKRFISANKDHSLEIIYRTEVYFPLIDKIFTEYDLPLELKYLTIVESALVLNAKSYVGAAGIWQFMPATARNLKLRVDSKIDQRLDPVLSTHAAAKYFKTLYGMFNDWSLVLAAYNCGEYKVKSVLNGSTTKDFWSIRKYLPKQTQNFVPAFIGASYMMQYHMDHELLVNESVKEENKLTFVKINKEVKLRELYSKTSINGTLFKQYNPSFKQGIIPANHNGSYVSLPDSLMVEFVEFYTFQNSKNKNQSNPNLVNVEEGQQLELISFCRPFVFPPDNIAINQVTNIHLDIVSDSQKTDSLELPAMMNGNKYEYHVVGSRQSLMDIAEQYKVNLEDLISWNEDKSYENIRSGDVLKIKL